MNTSEYRKWIEAGLRDYGKDPWFFIRELAQNSRDAGAGTIRVKATHTPEKEEILVFQDDGHGMTYDHAVRYLFRLYASSKFNEKYAAGRFGIGFWTVLKFNPSKIIIESYCKKQKWGVEVDADLKTFKIPGDLKHRGTRVTLIRPAKKKSPAAFLNQVEEALMRYCSYLRRNNRQADLLPVLFEGKNIAGEMKLPGPVSLSFKNSQVEGVVGLGARPQVRLYARGLPVWQGTTLEELSHTPPPRSRQRRREAAQMAQGLAPVFLVNGSSLEVNISRRKVIDNRSLQKVRTTAENALSQLVEMVADNVSPRNLFKRFAHRFKKGVSSILRSFWKSLLAGVLILLPLEYVLLSTFFKKTPSQPQNPVLSMQVENSRYSGGSVNPISTRRRVDITYQPPVTTWFKLYHVEEYREALGFTRDFTGNQPAAAVPFRAVDCGREVISIQFKTPETGTLLLPQPLGHHLDPGSLTLDHHPLLSTVYTRYTGYAENAGDTEYRSTGGVVITIPHNGVLRYRCCVPLQPEESENTPLSPEGVKRLTQLPSGFFPSLPDSLQKPLEESTALDSAQKVESAARLTVSFLRYDDSDETAEKYSDSSSDNWFQKVIAIGAGDCDILNGVTILFLRRMSVPARLVVGLVGRSGRVLPGMHAWTEYYDGEWKNFDTTSYAATSPSSTPPEPGTAAPGIEPAALSESETFEPDRPSETGGNINTGGRSPFYNSVFLALLSFLFLASLFLLLVKRTQRKSTIDFREPHRVEENLAGMALHSLLHPGAWGDDTNIRNVHIIPTIKGTAISLRRALKLSRLGKLFTLHHANPLVEDLEQASSSIPILEAGHPGFDPLIKALPEAVSLDRITALKAVPAEKADNPLLGQLLTAVNRLISPPCLAAPGIDPEEENFVDVDLSHLPLFSRMGIPNRFIAVNPHTTQVQSLAALFEKNPQLAQFRLIKALLKGSNLVPGPPGRVIEKASLRLIKEMG